MRALHKNESIMNIRLGSMAPPLSRQLRKFNLDKKKVKQFQRDNDAISRLYVRGIISETTKIRAYNALVRSIKKEIKDID